MSSTFQDPDVGKSSEQLYNERLQRMQDAIALRQPDRIPIVLGFGYMLAEMNKITRQQYHEDPVLAHGMLEKAAVKYQPDVASGVFGFGPGASLAVGDQMTKWPGHGLGPNGSFQFDEQEFMKADDYDAFIEDPSDWSLRTYLPRAFSEMKGLAALPPFGMWSFGFYHLGNILHYANPEVIAAVQALNNAIQSTAVSLQHAIQSGQRMAELGFPGPFFLTGSLVEAPFDYMSDTLRGMRGIMLDMHKRPDKLLAAEEKVLNFQVEFAINNAKITGNPYVFIPLHRGSDGFMSLPQFETFYWPQLKTMLLRLIDAGLFPGCFYEGIWDQRLDYLTEIPGGKSYGWFQSSNIFKVKEVVGETMCIMGGMPNSLLQAGSVDEVRAYTKEVCEKVGRDGGFVMSTGIGEMEGSQPELVKAWVQATKEFGVY